MSQRETDQDLVPEPQDEVEERFQNEKQRGSLEAAGRPAESTPARFASCAFPFRFSSLYIFGQGRWLEHRLQGLTNKSVIPWHFASQPTPGSHGATRAVRTPLSSAQHWGPRTSSAEVPQGCGLRAGADRRLAWATSQASNPRMALPS